MTSVPVLSPADALRAPARSVVDLRSPAEYAEDHLPGAANVPLFDDDERAVIGTLYARSSREAAFREGIARTQANVGRLVRDVARLAGWSAPERNLPELVGRIAAEGLEGMEGGLRPAAAPDPPEAPVVLYCWRGGLRSRSVVALLRALGLERAHGLEGGYKAYRRLVRERLATFRFPESTVLFGLTGVGKTLVLREIERRRGRSTLDLEGLAGHRSSILGMVGLEPVSQKAFESALVERLAAGFAGACVVEGESRKVGDVVLPAPVWEAIERGRAVELTAPLERRVQVLAAEYLERPENVAELEGQLPFLESRLGRRWSGVLVGMLRSERVEELVEILLERYYDPRYRHSGGGRHYAARFDASDPNGAAAEIVAWLGL